MIQVNPPQNRPITVVDALAYLGLADDANGLVANMLEATIRDVELATGAGIGVSNVTAVIYSPVPSRVRLPYSPIAQIASVSVIDELSGTERQIYNGTGSLPFLIRERVPAEIIFATYALMPLQALKIVYSGGYGTPPPQLKNLVLQTLAARWMARSTTIMPDVSIDDDAYLKVIM